MSSLPLFNDFPQPPTRDAERSEPALWIRRLRILKTPQIDSEEARPPIEFRRGLNIVATAINPGDGSARNVGHSVGKSLLLRLIRYCLGEPTFGERAVRQGIANFLPHGYVIAEVLLNGTPWYVMRPLGLDSTVSASWAASTEEAALFDETSRLAYPRFQEAIEEALLSEVPQIRLPHAQRQIHWTDILAWLSPDQTCAHKSHVEWRPGGTDPSTRGLRVEDNHIIIRTLMDLLSPEDSGLIQTHKRLLSRQGHLGRQIDQVRAVLRTLEEDLLADETIDVEGMEGEMLATRIGENARQQIESLGRLLDDELEDDPVAAWKEQHDDIQQRLGAARQSEHDERIDLETAQAQLERLQNNDFANELDLQAELGEWCHLFLTRDAAIQRGCPGVGPQEPGAVDPGRERRIRDLNATIASCNTRITAIAASITSIENDATESARQLRGAQQALAARLQPIRDRIATYQRIQHDAQRFLQISGRLRMLEGQFQSVRNQIQDSLSVRREADRRWRDNRQALADCFRYFLAEILGPDADGTIELNANGIFPRPAESARSRGEALKTTTVLSFDFGCLGASVAGIGHHPRFLLHDSPRNADMEQPLYHTVFQTIAKLESIFGGSAPSFQYIVTTTTPPPAVLDNETFVRLRLDARTEDELLLRHRF